MCIGVPLRVARVDGERAWCTADGACDGPGEWLDMRLVGTQAIGAWVLAFHGAARQVLGAAEAAQARAGRDALAAVLRGETDVDRYFADLIAHEPTLPAHLVPPASNPVETA